MEAILTLVQISSWNLLGSTEEWGTQGVASLLTGPAACLAALVRAAEDRQGKGQGGSPGVPDLSPQSWLPL